MTSFAATFSRLSTEESSPLRSRARGPLFWVHLTDKELTDYRSFVASQLDWPGSDFFAHHMLDRGIVCINRDFGCLSTPMGREEMGLYIDALEASLEALRP